MMRLDRGSWLVAVLIFNIFCVCTKGSRPPHRPPHPIFRFPPKWMCRPLQVVGLARAGGGRAVRIGNDLTKIDFLLKNVVLGHFWPFLDLLDVRNGSGSKFRVYGWYPEVCTTKISPFRGKSVIRPPFALFFSVHFLACVKKNAKLSSTNPPTHLPF